MEPDVAKYFAEHFERELRKRGAQVLSAADVEVMLGVERQKQLLGCSDGNCMAELGNALGADAMVVVSVVRLDGSLRAAIKVLVPTTGKLLAETEASAGGDEAFLAALTNAADRVGVSLGLESASRVAERERRAAAWLPGIGAGVFAVGSATCFVLSGVQLGALDRELSAMGAVTPRARGIADAGKVLEGIAWASGGVAVAALVTTAILYFTGAPPAVTPTVSAGPAGSVSFGFGGRL